MSAPQLNRPCSKCAAILTKLASGRSSILIGPPSHLECDRCEVCEFFMRCLRTLNAPISAPRHDIMFRRADKQQCKHYLGIIEETLPEPVWTNAAQFWEFSKWGTDDVWRLCLRFPVSVELRIDVTPAKIDWGHVKDWVRSDSMSHSNDSRLSEDCPLVVIDCHSRSLVQIASGVEYVTLSYVWGPNNAVKDSDCAASDSLARLPPTIDDSILVCLNLEYRYLWVDRYCIPQSDSQERHRLIRKMDRIYANSTLTIVACAGESPQYGLPGVTRPRNELPGLLIEESYHLQSLPMARDINRSVWAQRGWTYQEAVLCQRSLYFTDLQLYFEGYRSMQCEWLARSKGCASETASRIFSKPGRTFDMCDIWGCIEEYARRVLTFENDALNAMLGIFAVFERQNQVRHIWGMPYTSMKEDTKEDNTDEEAQGLSIRCSLCFTELHTVRRRSFPSWSWLGWGKDVLWPYHPPKIEFVYTFELSPELASGRVISWSDYNSDHYGSDQYNDQLSRFIHIQAYMTSIESYERIPMQRGLERVLHLADGTILLCDFFGNVMDRAQDPLEQALLIYMGVKDEGRDMYLIVENRGEYWERLGTVQRSRGTCPIYHSPRGTLRTIRLG